MPYAATSETVCSVTESQSQTHCVPNVTGISNTCTSDKSCDSDATVTSTDPAHWFEIDDTFIDRLVQLHIPQNDDCDLSSSSRMCGQKRRCVTRDMFYRTLPNGKKTKREWLVYSMSSCRIYCIPCKLFSTNRSNCCTEGFSDWHNISAVLKAHETSVNHSDCVLALAQRKNITGRVDWKLCAQVEDEKKYWRKILKRIVATVKFLATHGLAFRGNDNLFGSPHNGNYLGALELLAEFDEVLSSHIKRYGNAGQGVTSYLSSVTCNEIIDLMAKKVQEVILQELKEAKYYSFTVDSTPDMSHIDQLTFVVRYVLPDRTPVERFLTFIPLQQHRSASLEDTLMTLLNKFNINLEDCCGQCYDNASNMSGHYSGLQARIKSRNSLAQFIPCSAHSLNLVGSCAAESNRFASNYFMFLQSIYNFFSVSTHRWGVILKQQLNSDDNESLTLKSLSVTRWSARHDASKALKRNYKELGNALEELAQMTAKRRALDKKHQVCSES